LVCVVIAIYLPINLSIEVRENINYSGLILGDNYIISLQSWAGYKMIDGDALPDNKLIIKY
jgi:hypothetical protein